MDVDSSMAPDTDQDSTSKNNDNPNLEQLEQSAEDDSGGSQPATQQHSLQPQQQAQGSPVVGPRHAPTYTVVNAILDKKEDGPGPRCGHTLTAVAAVGEEGTPGYIGPRLILFGGATALEGNSAASGTPTSAGSAGISMLLFDALDSKFSSSCFVRVQLCGAKQLNYVLC